MRHEDQFLQVTLLGFEGALDGRKLVVKAHSLLLEALDDLLIGAADGLRLVVLDQRLVEAVLQHADVPRHRAVLVQGAHRIALQVLHAVGHLVELPVEAVRHLHDVIASLAQVINIRRELAELGIDSSVVGIGLAPLARGQGRELRAELLVLLLSVGDGLHVLLHRPLRRLVERLPVALQEDIFLLQVCELLIGIHARGPHRGRAPLVSRSGYVLSARASRRCVPSCSRARRL
mmetsp:Transcript_64614/g.203978  ORF Transcript_64614/g.203978 Transcript_64614/m.203978 type:complete len:233 (-) Transcript_64614:47-745(-)